MEDLELAIGMSIPAILSRQLFSPEAPVPTTNNVLCGRAKNGEQVIIGIGGGHYVPRHMDVVKCV